MIIIEEQGTRDGFQVEKQWIPTDKKIEIINRLSESGLKRIQVSSFVNPKYVPQMADAAEVIQGITQKDGVLYSALVLNVKGVEKAINSGLKHIACSISASDTHSRKNTNKSLDEAMIEFSEMIRIAKQGGLKVRGGLQCAFGCRFEGKIDEKFVIDLAKRHLDLGIDEIALADSTGMGNPQAIKRIMSQVLQYTDNQLVGLHLHDTEGKGIANLLAGIEVGVTIFDTAFGGLGGCPFIKGATGNIATEDVVVMLEQMGISTGIDFNKIINISQEMEFILGKKLPGKIKEVENIVI